MKPVAEQISELMKVLWSSERLMGLSQLGGVERLTSRRARPSSRHAGRSQQMSLLRRKGIVAARREGQTIFYAADRDGVGQRIALLYETDCARFPACRLSARRMIMIEALENRFHRLADH